MALLSININSGHCQGIIAGEVYSPKPGVALVTLKVKGGKSDPETKKRPLYFIQFIAYDELAEELIKKGEEGRILYLHFYLSTNNRKNENGVSTFYYNRIADRAVFGKVIGDEPVNAPYLNSGVLQGEFAGIRRVYDGRNQWSLLVRDSEVYIGIYGVMAQSESENISANVKWGINKRMQNGTYACRFTLLGYRRNKDTKEIYIVPEEAETVKQIFQMYLQGRSLDQIKRHLEENNILTVRGNPVWDKGVIKSMLTNEKYVGDIMFQKTYREDCISKRTKINRGEMDRYLVTDNHPAIIDRETFRMAKKEMVKRSS